MLQIIKLNFADAGERLDTWLAANQPSLSRSRWQKLISDGFVLVNGQVKKCRYVIQGNEQLKITIPPPENTEITPENLPLDILYEDPDLVVINKPPNCVVHPAPGHTTGTLVNALLHHCGDLAVIGGEKRPGIVHRLDKDTSGILVVAKNDLSMQELQRQFKSREVHKEYIAIVRGHLKPPAGIIETLVGRSSHDRKKMTARPARGRPAVTHYTTLQKLANASLLRIRIETGRTHQIRVHLTHLGHPVLGDRQYGHIRQDEVAVQPSRQMLHAERLVFTHPRSRKAMEFIAPIPNDIQSAISALRVPQ